MHFLILESTEIAYHDKKTLGFFSQGTICGLIPPKNLDEHNIWLNAHGGICVLFIGGVFQTGDKLIYFRDLNASLAVRYSHFPDEVMPQCFKKAYSSCVL